MRQNPSGRESGRSARGQIAGLASLFLIAIACGSTGDQPSDPPTDPNNNPSNTFGDTDAAAPCQGLRCNQVACPGGGTTSLSGKVYLPEGTVPLYNAIVYVPNAPVSPFPPGVACDQCGTSLSGDPITTALTDSSGSFVLKNVPVGVDIPLVVQIGRWRRQLKIPKVAQSCTDTKLDAAVTRLPKNKAEGDIPQIAITTGGADSLECFLRKLGIDDAEITNAAGTGRVHLFQGRRTDHDGSRIDNNTTAGSALWDDLNALRRYDMVILSCEGAENNGTKSAGARDNVLKYLDAGGRVFLSHFHYTWLKNGAGQLPRTATWLGNEDVGNGTLRVDTSFAKGQAFSEWLVNVQGSTAAGQVPATELRRNVSTVPATNMPAETSRRWLYLPTGNEEHTKFYSFNAPISQPADKQCGRGVYTDIHVSSGDGSGGTFPSNCTTKGLTPQEKALLFLLMDLAACVQDDSKAPTAPPPVVR